ncbi:RNA-directed DNA polymerase (Reverse transcriptase), Ribonuclease H-like protein [Gossypium australe]|uniref:RNA-directed DNA polymerase (Reverse transcriptase), Ribonuclease H-like protein n=1 Tax=Gossypium australe TaxID=47621 RepID=A0A5B6VK19_9ROSI|nr:RNA-directed DNA polymerase (Reverse transcriptase), Ribonuclease H-like protein [Gossypium australe]
MENVDYLCDVDAKELSLVPDLIIDVGLIVQDLEEVPKETIGYYEFHAEEGHKIQECTKFRTLVQSQMDNNELEFFEDVKGSEGGDICTSEEGSTEKVHKDSKRVPWNYDCNVMIPREENSISGLEEGQDIVEHKKEKTARLESPVNEPVNENDAKEFLKFLKHSEYSFVEQLHKQPAHISVLVLLLSSETHRSALVKVLNETYVANDIFVNKLDRLVNNISANSFIFFNDDEIPPRDKRSTKVLHITTRCKGYTFPGVLMDNRFVDFFVMDIKPTYNFLLDRPWIHSAGVVSSSLHQKLKLVMEGRLVTINAEEDIIAPVTSDALYIGADDEAIECSFQLLEFVNMRGKRRESWRRNKKKKSVTEWGRGQMGTDVISSYIQNIRVRRNHLSSTKNDRKREPGRNVGKLELQWYIRRRNWGKPVRHSSPYINDMSDVAINLESPFKQDMCLEELHDFENDRDCNLSSDLLRMVEQEEKQILPHKESVEIVSLGDEQEKKDVKIEGCITTLTKRDLIKLLQEFKDVFAWSYQDMSSLSTDIVVHRLPIKEECKPVQQKLQMMRPDVLLKIKEKVNKQFDASFLQWLNTQSG